MKKIITESKEPLNINMEISKLSITTILTADKSNSFKDFWIIKLNKKSY